jgi:hypothetical protein
VNLALLDVFVQIELLIERRTTYTLEIRRFDTLGLVSLHLG